MPRFPYGFRTSARPLWRGLAAALITVATPALAPAQTVDTFVVPEAPGFLWEMSPLTGKPGNAPLNTYVPPGVLYSFPPLGYPLFPSPGLPGPGDPINPARLSSATDSTVFQRFSGNSVPSGKTEEADPTSANFGLGANGVTAATEPSAVGMALAPFVFAGAALIRRHIGRNRKKK